MNQIRFVELQNNYRSFFVKLSEIQLCGLKRITNIELPFSKKVYAQIFCGVFEFEIMSESALICRHKECYT